MNDNVFAKMYLAGNRRVEQDHLTRTLETIRETDLSDTNTTGRLMSFREETLAPGQQLAFTASADMILFLFPLVGTVVLQVGDVRDEVVNVGETMSLPVKKSTRFTIINPHDDQLVNYAQCWFQQPGEKNDANEGMFIELRRFDGREEMEYSLHDPMNRVFVWVVQGAFEVKNRLLEQRDAMILRGLGDIDAEALSNEAVLLLIEYV